MKDQLKESYSEVLRCFDEHANINRNLALIKADAEKYGREIEAIEQMQYTDITEAVVGKLTAIRMRLDLIPKAQAFAEKQLMRAGHEAHKSLEVCLGHLDAVFGDYAAKTEERLVKVLKSQGVSAVEAKKLIENSEPIQKIRRLSEAARSGQFHMFQSIPDGWRICAETKARLAPFIEEAVKDNPNFDRFLTAE
jgi:hypothetical protein